MTMYRVVDNTGVVSGLVDTMEDAKKVVNMRKGGKGKSSTMDYTIEPVDNSVHPGYAGK